VRSNRSLGVILLGTVILVLGACGGEDGDGSNGDDGGGSPAAGATGSPEATSSADGAATATEAGTSASSPDGGAAGAIDMCALLSQEEVSAVIGQEAGAPAADDMSPFYGCRYESEDVTPIVSVGVFAWDDESQAESSFSFGADQYEEVPGLGDAAYRSQPIDEVTVLHGRYEISVGLYFVSEDDDEEFEMGVELAQMVLERLP
jgi:hypothetical protein